MKHFICQQSLKIIFLFFAVFIVCCNKKFDEPPAYIPPDISPTLTIAQLKSLHVNGSTETIITDDIIEGVVIANDSSGNFYKQIIIEDETAGISINIDDNNLYTSYSIGRKVFIKMKGLILYDDNNLISIGGSKDVTNNVNAIAGPLKNQFIIKGTANNPVIPKLIDISDLNPSYQNTLIQLNNVEFDEADTSKQYADTSPSKNTVNLIIKNCSDKSVILRTSGYAGFAGVHVPNGNGTITAIYSVYRTTSQLYIRDTADIHFNGTRCDGGPAVQTSIANIRSLYKGHDIKIGAYKIGGTVISDAANKNISSGSIVLQDGNAGISVYFGGAINYAIGDSVVLDITGDSLLSYQGSLEIKTANGTIKPNPVATGKIVIPQQLSIAQLNDNLTNLEFTLVKIANASVIETGTFSGSKTLSDASGSITLYTSPSATFAGDNVPSHSADWVGFGKYFGTTKEFTIRNTTDVQINDGSNNDGIELNSSPFVFNFDNIAAGLPAGILVKISASSTSLGNDGTFNTNQSTWSNTSSGFKNLASATGLLASSSSDIQGKSTNRVLGVKQTGSTGYDPGAAFVFQINNTSGKSNFIFNFLLQSLAENIGRTTNWQVDYAFGNSPTIFTPVATSPSTLITDSNYISTPVTVDFGNLLDNKNEKVWIRIVTLKATTGNGTRATTAIDDVKFSWQE
ncbi:MAG: hypothetical protein JST21_13475 [Bacteroidetes bacterium]|nr:hypothetical protein [Bacteroidota bacterium]